ncbi:WecB/TagA/CpsF family glycosyltransferase [Sphingomonas sp. 1P06PA]|uniref:WecB/TagA/CpsF family glycosyltransferase n=1 Tax=Sphingomonas sp. 1P06PA TaxID=554121 RepID=UPI0039A57A3D
MPVSLVNPVLAVETVLGWAVRGSAQFICVRDVHGVMLAQDDDGLMDIHRQAGMVLPDGMPLVGLARWRGHSHVARTCGPDFVDALCAGGIATGLRHYFFGGKPGVAEAMAAALADRHPGLVVAGTSTPPFRTLSMEEDGAATQQIIDAKPDIVWIGLSTPKQEYWMRDHVDRIPGATLIGVGAAFDFHTGAVSRAPRWMQRSGLEWLHRLVSEPRRLWRRYLVLAPRFVWRLATSKPSGDIA